MHSLSHYMPHENFFISIIIRSFVKITLTIKILYKH